MGEGGGEASATVVFKSQRLANARMSNTLAACDWHVRVYAWRAFGVCVSATELVALSAATSSGRLAVNSTWLHNKQVGRVVAVVVTAIRFRHSLTRAL